LALQTWLIFDLGRLDLTFELGRLNLHFDPGRLSSTSTWANMTQPLAQTSH